MAECGSSQAQLLIERLVILVEFLFFSVPADITTKAFFYIVHYQPVIQSLYHAVESVVQITGNTKGNQNLNLTTLIFCIL